MNTRVVMVTCAAFLALVGLALTFMPHELLSLLGAPASEPWPLILQVYGSSLVGWALVNWMSRGQIIGGIYGRPLTMGNFFHFLAGGLALAKATPALHSHPAVLVLLVGYGALAVLFGFLIFAPGVPTQERQ